MQKHAAVEIQPADLANATHQQAILDLLDSYAREPHIGGVALAVDVRDRLISELGKQDAGRHWLAFEQTQAVGVAICFLGFSTFYARPLLNIHDLTVRDGHRGRGIGRQLLTTVEAAAAEHGCCKITLEVRSDNRARRLYEEFGFSAGESNQATFAFMSKLL